MDKNQTKFSSYFNDWLYGKDGYYANYKVIGKEGDFLRLLVQVNFLVGLLVKEPLKL